MLLLPRHMSAPAALPGSVSVLAGLVTRTWNVTTADGIKTVSLTHHTITGAGAGGGRRAAVVAGVQGPCHALARCLSPTPRRSTLAVCGRAPGNATPRAGSRELSVDGKDIPGSAGTNTALGGPSTITFEVGVVCQRRRARRAPPAARARARALA